MRGRGRLLGPLLACSSGTSRGLLLVVFLWSGSATRMNPTESTRRPVIIQYRELSVMRQCSSPTTEQLESKSILRTSALGRVSLRQALRRPGFTVVNMIYVLYSMVLRTGSSGHELHVQLCNSFRVVSVSCCSMLTCMHACI